MVPAAGEEGGGSASGEHGLMNVGFFVKFFPKLSQAMTPRAFTGGTIYRVLYIMLDLAKMVKLCIGLLELDLSKLAGISGR